MSSAAATSTALFAKLSSTLAISAIVATRIYPVKGPQDPTAPYIIFQQIASDPDSTHDEAAGATHRLFQFACFAATYEAAQALRDLVMATLDNATLSTGERPTLDDERDADLDEAVNLFRADADFLV